MENFWQLLRTGRALDWPSQLPMLRGNFTCGHHRFGCLLETHFPKPPHLRTTTEEGGSGHGTAWACNTKMLFKEIWARTLLSWWFKVWFSDIKRKTNSCSSPHTGPVPQIPCLQTNWDKPGVAGTRAVSTGRWHTHVFLFNVTPALV